MIPRRTGMESGGSEVIQDVRSKGTKGVCTNGRSSQIRTGSGYVYHRVGRKRSRGHGGGVAFQKEDTKCITCCVFGP